MRQLPSPLEVFFGNDRANMCFIGPEFLDKTPPQTSSICKSRSQRELTRFLAEHPVLASYALLKDRLIPERALLFATEVLGPDLSLTSEQLRHKSAMHLLMSVQMTIEWLLDDTLDVDASVDPAVAKRIVDYYLQQLEAAHRSRSEEQHLQAACLQNRIPDGFLEAVRLLATWQRELAAAVEVSLAPSSLYCRINKEFMVAMLAVHHRFDSVASYFHHRAANCGLGLEILCGTYWFSRLWGIDVAELERRQDHYARMIYQYSLLGGLNNDMFGYDKDLEEGVATGVTVVKQHQNRSAVDANDGAISDAEQETLRAFMWLTDFYNHALTRLVERCGTCHDPVEEAILAASLTTTWATCVLHHQFIKIYPPQSFRRALSERERLLNMSAA